MMDTMDINLFKSTFGKRFLVLLLFLSALAAQAKSPNIVFILTDDLNEEVFTHEAKIKSLITANGTKFDNHFVSLSLCCPSRTSTLRGQYAHNTGVFTNSPPTGGFAKVYADGLEQSTIATWLQGAGYRTALFGKYLNGYPNVDSGSNYIPPGWTYWVSPNSGKPYTEYNYSFSVNGKMESYGRTHSDHMVDVLSEKAVDFIKTTTANYPNNPFFIYLAPYSPHGPATPAPRHANDFPGIKAPRPASFDEADISDKPAWVQSKRPISNAKIAEIDSLYRKRRQAMETIGDMVENIVNALSAVGELDNTYIFFTSDNGFHQGQHRLVSGKNTAFEEDIKVPLVVRGPGVVAGATVSKITANVDFAPTFAEIAGITPPSFVDGRSFVPFLKGGKPQAWRKVLLLEHGGQSLTAASTNYLLEPQDAFDVQTKASKGIPIFAGLRTQKAAIGKLEPSTYVEYDTGEHELYHLSSDPQQLDNVYSTTEKALKNKLKTWLAQLRNASGQALRDAEERAP